VLPVWIDGALVGAASARVPVDDSAYEAGLGCYTTARWTGGRVRYGERAAARLVRDAERLGLGRADPAAVLAALAELGKAAFGAGEGIVRLQASRSADGALRLVGRPREVGPEPAVWTAVVAPFPHEGPAPWDGAKIAGHPRVALARAAARAAGADEALLFDAAGRLVEGARTSLAVALADGRWVAPPAARGGVRSVAGEIARLGARELSEGDVSREELARAREVVALNSVRGAVPIVRVDGRPVGAGGPGPLAAALREVLARAE
jgi:branched-subunit amino acid aminotransferase/4-amino-4-deoxychorismate lyase